MSQGSVKKEGDPIQEIKIELKKKKKGGEFF